MARRQTQKTTVADRNRTLEDRIAAADDDWPANTYDSKSARYPWSYVGDDVPEDPHARREKSVHDGELAALKPREGER
jgi:hypothetical protein